MQMRSRPAPPPFHSFFAEQAPRVGRFLRGMLPSEDAEECLQETFLAALRSWERFDGANPSAWVLTIARRKAIDAARAGGRRPLPVDPGEHLALAASSDPAEPGEVWGEVAELPPKQRAAVLLRFALDMPHREIGAVLGCSEAAARRSLHEAVVKLRQRRVGRAA
jgi:DNA-directed RNA polymerase specialized sigma24 family protein